MNPIQIIQARYSNRTNTFVKLFSLALVSFLAASCDTPEQRTVNSYVQIPADVGNYETIHFAAVSSPLANINYNAAYYQEILPGNLFTIPLVSNGDLFTTGLPVTDFIDTLFDLQLISHGYSFAGGDSVLAVDSVSFIQNKFKSLYVAYDKAQGSLDILSILDNNVIPLAENTDTLVLGSGDVASVRYKSEFLAVSEFTIMESIKFSEHAMWSKGDPFMDTQKKWTIESIFDSNMNPLITPGYDCLYDNSFTFFPGNKMMSDLGDDYCTDLDQPLLDQGQDTVFQQYAIVDEPGQDYPYVYITTPGALFAPQRMYMLSFDQEEAFLSTAYGSDSIFLKLIAQ